MSLWMLLLFVLPGIAQAFPEELAPARAPAPVPAPAICFDSEIMPMLTKAGCNSGACHGAAAGRGGFHLSLLGADPEADYSEIVQEFEGRRINLVRPDRSLLLLKATEQLEHGGSTALEYEGHGADRLLKWIQAGVPRGQVRQLTELQVAPVRQQIAAVPATVSLRATAVFDDQTTENVTDWTVFAAADPASVEIDSAGQATVLRRGQHLITARFLQRVVPIQITVPLSDVAMDFSGEPRHSFVDDHIFQVLSELRIPVSKPAADHVWLRRVCLDLTGQLPTPKMVEDFQADRSSDKREQVVDQLLESEAFADYWTLRFSKWLRMHSLPNDKEGVRVYSKWLRQQIRNQTPLSQIGMELLTATGDSHVNGPANFSRMVTDARDQAELVGQFFMGARLGCANCHNHPLDRWTQDDYHGFAAIFSRLDRGRMVTVTERGGVTNLRTGEPAVPRLPGERDLAIDVDHSDVDQRKVVAQWLTSGENSYFATVTVNRLWKAIFGRGLVEPVDDLRPTNPATHPELLEQLAADFVEHDYNIRQTLKQLVLSHAYARSSDEHPGNEADDRFYSHALRRRLEPEVLLDAIADVTGVAAEFPELPSGTRAVSVVDALEPAPMLTVLGRCSHPDDCEIAAGTSAGLTTQLHLMNGELINDRIVRRTGRLHQSLLAGASDEEIVSDFYLRAFSRRPTPLEHQQWIRMLSADDGEERIQRLEDFVWALLNSREFVENH